MSTTTYLLGHLVFRRNTISQGEGWYYEDYTKAEGENIRPCKKCGKQPTAEGHDSCIANLPGVKNACCGHGIHDAYIQFEDDRIIRGQFKVEPNAH